jgi:DNA-binding response OmpR family regulator
MARGPQRILVVDDNPDAALTMRLLMESLGQHVRVAHSGRAAMEVAAQFCPEICFVDLILPDIEGGDLAQDLKQLLGSRVRVFMFTAHAGEEHQIRSLIKGCDGPLVKPVNPRAIETLISRD